MRGAALAAALTLCGGPALAVDQLITAKKLLITNPPSGPQNNRLVYLTKDQTVALPGGPSEDPRCPADGSGGGTLVVRSPVTSEGFTIGLPCQYWTVNSAGDRFRYQDPTGATCKLVLIKGGRFEKAVCKGAQVSYDLGVNQVSIDLKLRTGSAPRQWCTAFNDTTEGCTIPRNGSDDRKYLAKDCTTGPLVCAASPSPAFIDAEQPF
jgi:hypothetical protein